MLLAELILGLAFCELGPEELKLLLVELLHLSAWGVRYMTCMKDWCAFSFNWTICPCRVYSVVRHLLLRLDLDSYFDLSLKPEALFEGCPRPPCGSNSLLCITLNNIDAENATQIGRE